ncbi:MAG TPA: response regulator [Polyangiaceae bacterium]|jgi:DNA-binding NtrC family response regulator
MESDSTTTRILVLDDDAEICEVIGEILGQSGYEVTSSTRPEEAIQLLENKPFDIFITDYRIGETNGLEMCHHAVRSNPNLPVILLTGYGTMDTAIEAIRVGAFDFVAKPSELDALSAALRQSVQRALDSKKQKEGALTVGARDGESLMSLDELERQYIEKVLTAVGGNKASAARVLGVDRTTLYRKLQRYGPKS